MTKEEFVDIWFTDFDLEPLEYRDALIQMYKDLDKVINTALTQFTIGEYKERVLKLEAELKNLHKANIIKSVCYHEFPKPNTSGWKFCNKCNERFKS